MLLGGALGSSFASLANRQTAKQIDEVVYATEVEPKFAEGKNTVLSPELTEKSAGAQEVLGDVQISGKSPAHFLKHLHGTL